MSKQLGEDIFYRKDQQKSLREMSAHSDHFVSLRLTFVNINISEAIVVFKVGWLEFMNHETFASFQNYSKKNSN